MNKSILLIGLITLLGFGIGGILIIGFFQELTFLEVWRGGQNTYRQLWIGGLTGLLASGIALFIISRKFFEKEKAFYYGLIGNLGINLPGIIFLSLCAGIGEEIFFRAAVQPFLGNRLDIAFICSFTWIPDSKKHKTQHLWCSDGRDCCRLRLSF